MNYDVQTANSCQLNQIIPNICESCRDFAYCTTKFHTVEAYEYISLKEVPGMFGTEKEVKAEQREYIVKVDAARTTKNDAIVMIDLDVNGVKIKSCILKEVTVKKTGTKYKAGDTIYLVQFPSDKVGEKYYNRVWFPITNEHIADIVRQVKDLM